MTSVRENLETEAKFDVDLSFELPDLRAVARGIDVETKPAQSLETVYFDTRDFRLARAGASLRCRTGEGLLRRGTGRWTLKLQHAAGDEAGGEVVRREIVVDAPVRAVPHELASAVRGLVRDAPMAPVATLRSDRRRSIVSRGGQPALEIDDDRVDVVEGGRADFAFREIEVERLDGASDRIVKQVARALHDAGARPAERSSKIARAMGSRAVDPAHSSTPPLNARSTIGEVATAAVVAGTARLLRHDPGVRIGGDDEDVHQARVATRRLRSDLRTFRSVLDSQATAPVRDELRWLGAALGAARDADVLLGRIAAHACELPSADARGSIAIIKHLEAERDAARELLLGVLDTDRYLALVDSLVLMSRHPPLLADADRRAATVLAGIVAGEWKKLRREVSRLGPAPDDAALHRVRIVAKRARYAVEAATPTCGKPAARLARSIAGLQGVLGDLNDAVVAEAWLRGTAKSSAGVAFAAGQLVAIERNEQAAARAAWPKAWKAAVTDGRRWPS